MTEVSWKNLSAAELLVLQSPEVQQTPQAMRLLMKEMVFRGWVTTARGELPVSNNAIGAFIIISFIGAIISIFLGFFLAAIFFVVVKNMKKEQVLLTITPKGKAALQTPPPGTSVVLQQMLRILDLSVHRKYDVSTLASWRKKVGNQFSNNQSFHDNLLMNNLIGKGLVSRADANSPAKLTNLGHSVRYKAEQDMEEARRLPELLRRKDVNAIALATGLGVLLLLMPEMEGYFGPLSEMLNNDTLDIDKYNRNLDSDGGSSASDGGYDSGSHHDHHGTGADWGSNADFLDSSDGDAGGSGCGVGDGGGDSGDGGDGGDSGCGSGCGGCGGD